MNIIRQSKHREILKVIDPSTSLIYSTTQFSIYKPIEPSLHSHHSSKTNDHSSDKHPSNHSNTLLPETPEQRYATTQAQVPSASHPIQARHILPHRLPSQQKNSRPLLHLRRRIQHRRKIHLPKIIRPRLRKPRLLLRQTRLSIHHPRLPSRPTRHLPLPRTRHPRCPPLAHPKPFLPHLRLLPNPRPRQHPHHRPFRRSSSHHNHALLHRRPPTKRPSKTNNQSSRPPISPIRPLRHVHRMAIRPSPRTILDFSRNRKTKRPLPSLPTSRLQHRTDPSQNTLGRG